MSQVLSATVDLDRGFRPDQVQPALTRMLTALTFRHTPLRVEWDSPTLGHVYLPPFGYRRNFRFDLELEPAATGGFTLRMRSETLSIRRVPLLFHREIRTLWDTILERAQLLT